MGGKKLQINWRSYTMHRSRVAIFHDYIDAIGGGEKTILTLARAINADIITTDVNKDSVKKMGFEDARIISLGRTMKIPPLKQIQASFLFALCNFSKEYDYFIFSGNWAHYAAWRHKPNLWYCYTPVRAFYDLKEAMANRQPNIFLRVLFLLWADVHSYFDRFSVARIQKIVVISKNVLGRVRRFYGREAKVVNSKKVGISGSPLVGFTQRRE
jgi:hypothetical protein